MSHRSFIWAFFIVTEITLTSISFYLISIAPEKCSLAAKSNQTQLSKAWMVIFHIRLFGIQAGDQHRVKQSENWKYNIQKRQFNDICISYLLKLLILLQWSFIVAALTVTGSCLWFLCINQSSRVFTYPAVVLLGFGSSAMFVNALGFATELIGDNKVSWRTLYFGFYLNFHKTYDNYTNPIVL